MRVKCFAQEHNTMSLTRALILTRQTQQHGATVPPTKHSVIKCIYLTTLLLYMAKAVFSAVNAAR